MADLTVRELLLASMRVAQVLRKGEDPDAQEMEEALGALKMMLQLWSTRKLLVRATVPENFALTANVGSYTIGVGGAFNTSKPIGIENAFIRDSNNLDYPLDIRPMEFFNSIGDKAVTVARPEILFYDPGLTQQATQTGTISLYGIPDTVYTLYIRSKKYFTDPLTITETLTFDSAYNEPIKYNLAMRLWGEYHKGDPPSLMVMLADSGVTMLEALNSTPVLSQMDLPGCNMSPYNVYTGNY